MTASTKQIGVGQVVQDEREQQLQVWLAGVLETPYRRLIPLAGDASFRRYFRVDCGETSYVAMDAPPDKESCLPFVAIAKTFLKLGLNVPVIYAEDVSRGFLLLTDFGDELYVNALTKENANELYQHAFDDLLLIQSCTEIEGYVLPRFNRELYYKEMSLFRDWYLIKHLGISLSKMEWETLEEGFQLLIEAALAQPQMCVHRDYHSRNLIRVPESRQPGVLDFQDAVWGPVTYDLLSLLRDCYIDWPPEQVELWALHYQKQVTRVGLLEEVSQQQFLQWFDWIGLQRHLKCIGIFTRLKERDNKSSYLQYIPRVIRYAKSVCERYPELTDLNHFFERAEGKK